MQRGERKPRSFLDYMLAATIAEKSIVKTLSKPRTPTSARRKVRVKRKGKRRHQTKEQEAAYRQTASLRSPSSCDDSSSSRGGRYNFRGTTCDTQRQSEKYKKMLEYTEEEEDADEESEEEGYDDQGAEGEEQEEMGDADYEEEEEEEDDVGEAGDLTTEDSVGTSSGTASESILVKQEFPVNPIKTPVRPRVGADNVQPDGEGHDFFDFDMEGLSPHMFDMELFSPFG